MYNYNFDQTLLGVFLSLKKANMRARDYVADLNVADSDDEEGDESEEEDEDYVWDGSEEGEIDGDCGFDKVWVECRPIEAVSRLFRP